MAIFASLVRPSLWRLTVIIALYLFLELVLPNQVLVSRCVVIIGEELSQQ